MKSSGSSQRSHGKEEEKSRAVYEYQTVVEYTAALYTNYPRLTGFNLPFRFGEDSMRLQYLASVKTAREAAKPNPS